MARLRSPLPPGERPGDPPAVEREGGDQVEEEDEDVDGREPGDDREMPDVCAWRGRASRR